MFRNAIRGLEGVIETDNFQNMIIEVMGYAGTLKSSFVYSMMQAALKEGGGIGMYVTLEQNKESLLTNFKGIGIPLSNQILISDFNRTRELFREGSGGSDEGRDLDLLELTEHIVNSTKAKYGDEFKLFALDSLNVLLTMMRGGDLRKRVYYFFKSLRDAQVTSFLIKEEPRGGASADNVDDEFLADGVIELGVKRQGKEVKRYMQVLKLRMNKHSMRQFIIDITPAGIQVIGPSVDDMD